MDEGTFESKYIYIMIMEYCSLGDLTDKIREYKEIVQMNDPSSTSFSMPEH